MPGFPARPAAGPGPALSALDVLLFGDLCGLAALAGCDADLIAIGETVRRRGDDAVLRRKARGKLDGCLLYTSDAADE